MEYKLTFQDYNTALKQDKLMGLQCNDCGTITCPPMMVCGECGSINHEIVQLSGKGRIVTYTTSFIAAEGRESEVPYTIVMVELDEGPWIMGNLVSMDAKKITMDIIGKAAQLGATIYPGDKYSNGEIARAAFSLIE